MTTLDRRSVLLGGLAASALAGLGSPARAYGTSVFEAPGYFTFEAQMVAHNPADPMLAAFAAGSVDRRDHFQGAYNSVAGTVRLNKTRYRPYSGQAQFHIWGCSPHGVEGVRILDAAGDRQGVPRRPPYPVSIPEYGPPNHIFDLSGGDMAIAFPIAFITPGVTKAQWCAPSVPGIRPTPDIGIPYTPSEIAWHMGKSPFTTTFFLVNG